MTTQTTSVGENPPSASPQPATRLFRLRLPYGPYVAIWPATALLFVVSPFIAAGSLRWSALHSTLPFAAILVVVGVGQTLVIQQRGLDLSVPGMMSLSAIIVTKVPAGNDHKLPEAIVLVAVACAVAGLISGLAVTRLHITPLVATLGVNALLLGTILRITSGSSTATASNDLDRFAFASPLGISSLVWIAAALVIVTALVIRSTVAGRRFVMIGTSTRAARAAGMPVGRYTLLTYVVAALLYGAAGILLAGYLKTPGLSAGDSYLLPSIAAVVLGGTSLAGGGGSVVATAGGALFLTQLEQVVFGAGAPSSVQLLIQAGAIAAGMALRVIPWRYLINRIPTAPLRPRPG